MKLPRYWWLAIPVCGGLASIAAPIIYAQRNIPEELRSPVVVEDASVERDLACAIEATCGPLRVEATLTFAANGGDPAVSPPDALPPGYAACAARVVGIQITGAFRLAPCAPAAAP